MKIIFKTKFGSRLYGTHTNSSDYDFKTVYIPDAKSLLLNKEVVSSHNARFMSDGTVAQDRASVGPDGYEEEFIPVHKFLRGWAEGQTYVFEMLGAYHSDMHEYASDDFVFLYNAIRNIKNENYVKMISFAKSQIITISERINNYNHFIAARDILLTQNLTKNVGESLNPIAVSSDDQYVYVAGKKYAKNGKVKDALHSVNAQLQKYGSRVTGSIGNSDLKSISHAVRILDEVKTLREHGVITFPLPKSEYYKNIKLGKITKTTTELSEELSTYDLSFVDNHEELSTIADSLILSLYNIN